MRSILTISLLLTFNTFAQLDPESDMYWNNYSFSNPAMSGVNFKHEANVTHQSGWSDVNQLPTNWFVNYGINLGGKHGIGVNYVNETALYKRKSEIKLSYNYQFKLKDDRKLVIGTGLSFRRNRWVYPEWSFICWNFPPNINTFQADFGVAYYGKNITAGLSMTEIPISERSNYVNEYPQLIGNFRFEGSLLSLPELIYETRFQTDFINYRQDFNLGYKVKNFLEVGIGYRTSDAVLVNLTGIIAKKFRVGYSYAHSVNKLSNYSRGTHEIALGFRIPNK